MKYEYLDKITVIDLALLKKTAWLYEIVKWYLPNGVVDVSKIPVDIGARLDGWLILNHKSKPQPPPPPLPEPTWASKEHEVWVKDWVARKHGRPLPPQPAPVVVQPVPVVAAPPPAAPPEPWKAGDPLPDNATAAMLRLSSASDVKAWVKRKRS
jgi:hypothetical protein